MVGSGASGRKGRPHCLNMWVRSMNGAIGENSAMPSKFVPIVIGALVGGGGGGGVVLLVTLNQSSDVVNCPAPKLVLMMPVRAPVAKTLAKGVEPTVTQAESLSLLRRYWAVTVLLEAAPLRRRSRERRAVVPRLRGAKAFWLKTAPDSVPNWSMR